MVLAVHPDDESIGAAGLLQHAVARRARIRVIFVTDGDNNPWPQRFVERRWRINAEDRARWGERRRREAAVALESLGISQESAEFWGYPDQGLADILIAGGEGLIAKIATALNEFKPTLLVAPSGDDLHPDHNSLAFLLNMVLEREYPSRALPFTLLEYLVHGRRPVGSSGTAQIRLSPREVAAKQRAIMSHGTQMALCRRRFMAFAKSSEVFITRGASRHDDQEHPLLAAESEEGCLCLTLRRAKFDTILLALETREELMWFYIKNCRDLKPSVCSARTGELVTRARRVRGRDYDKMFLPASLFDSLLGVSLKVGPAWAMFDRFGWRRKPIEFSCDAIGSTQRSGRLEPMVCCVIPCYNVGAVCGAVVRKASLLGTVIAVDDGSNDDTKKVLCEIAEASDGKVLVLALPRNGGKGAALIEAFRYAVDNVAFDVLVTLDGDGQHRAEDIVALAQGMVGGRYDVVIGERLARSEMPLRSWVGNTLTAIVMRCFYPGAPSDTQSGFRAFRPQFIRDILERIRGGRYETELEILLLALRNGHRIGSVEIPTVYIDGNRLSHFRPLVDSLRIYFAFFRSRFFTSYRRPLSVSVKANF